MESKEVRCIGNKGHKILEESPFPSSLPVFSRFQLGDQKREALFSILFYWYRIFHQYTFLSIQFSTNKPDTGRKITFPSPPRSPLSRSPPLFSFLPLTKSSVTFQLAMKQMLHAVGKKQALQVNAIVFCSLEKKNCLLHTLLVYIASYMTYACSKT